MVNLTVPGENLTVLGESALSQMNAYFVDNILIASITFVSFLMLLGAPGNVLVFIVYFSRWRRTTSRIFIIALAACDIYNCCVSMPIELFFMTHYLTTDYPILCKVSRFLTFLTNDGSALILIGIAFDRFFRICLPFRTQMGTSRAKTICVIALLISLITGWPSVPLYGTTTLKINPTPQTVIYAKACLIDDAFTHTQYPLYFSFVILACNLIIDVILIGLYIAIAYTVIHSTQKVLNFRAKTLNDKEDCTTPPRTYSLRRSIARVISRGEKNPEDNRTARTVKTTIMLFVVTLVFMLSFVPYCVIILIRYTNPLYYKELSAPAKAVYHVFLRTYFLSSALNPVIYSFFSKRFRTECKIVLSKLVFFRYRENSNQN